MKTIKDIKNILILGSGTLGLRIGLACALNNYKVIIYDIHAKAFESAKNSQTNLLKILVKAGTIRNSKPIPHFKISNLQPMPSWLLKMPTW